MKLFHSSSPQDLGAPLQALFHNALILREEFGYDQFMVGKLKLNKDVLGFLENLEEPECQGLE